MKIVGRIQQHGKDWSVNGTVFKCNRKFNEWIIRDLEKRSKSKTKTEVWLRNDAILLGVKTI